MPWAMASSITGFNCSRSDGFTMIASTPCEIRFCRSAIWSVGPPFLLIAMTSLTWPLASDWALTAQIISSRQPLPARVLLTPMT